MQFVVSFVETGISLFRVVRKAYCTTCRPRVPVLLSELKQFVVVGRPARGMTFFSDVRKRRVQAMMQRSNSFVLQ